MSAHITVMNSASGESQLNNEKTTALTAGSAVPLLLNIIWHQHQPVYVK